MDYRLIDPNAKVEKEFSKSYAMAKNIYENYLETHATKGTQLGFIGLSTPKTHSQKVSSEVLDNAHETENKNPLDEAQELLESLSSYDENGNLIAPSKKELENELKEKEAKSVNLDEELAKSCSFDVYSDVLRHLVQMGIPQNEIAFIHDAKTEEQKQDLFKKLNRGEVRVLLGSPAKMGVGTNVQERLVAMHELDCRPDELLQMEGRGIRQGNILHQNDPENFRMKIYRYATEKTYDSRMWQIIETKSKGIEQFRNAHKLGLNELEDFNMGSSNASEMKAEATGNPSIIEEVKLRAEIKSEESKYKAFNKEHYFNEESLKNNASQWDYLKQELKDLETLQSSAIIPTHTEIKLYDLKNEESKDYELIKVKEIEPLKENASMSEELTHKKLKEQNKQIAEQNKEKLDAIKKQFASNLNDLFFNEERDYKLLEYKGFVVNAYKTKYQVEFSLSPKDNPNIAYSSNNMIYKNDTNRLFSSYNFCAEIKFDGFLKRLDNAIIKLPEKIKELEDSIETTKENISKYTRLVEQKPSYPRLEYLQALKWDHKTLIDDLAKMGKDRDYKPVFNPKSKEVLKNLNAEKRASLENEREEQGVKGNTKSHDEIEPATEQVIEKEIEKGAEIIYSKEVATTNNVDYYENEQEVEITKSMGRR
ncbi:putative helicase/DNA methylase domain protein [Helicobacter pylori Hp A-26]|uniref:Putative helicase/DNA methylase domain protein n=1 Tax=Helicobacter pylori Hp A-26 TaxID=992056 RepID=J0CL02_HELPX|nr:putative helicase/DNA methylase domain protein [Helicobacter pylori Hp A-26]